MKRVLLTFLVVLFGASFLTSCKVKKENEALVRKTDSLQTVINSQQLMIDNQTNEINDYIGYIVDIQKSLDAIGLKENELAAQSAEQTVITDAQRRAKLKEDINKLYDEVLASRKKIDNLNYQLGKSKKEISNLNVMVADLQKQIEQRNAEITEMRGIIDRQTAQITELNKDIEAKTQTIQQLENTVAQQISENNTAWYYLAKKSDLKSLGIIDRKGRIINNSSDHFTKIDLTKTTDIPVNSKRCIILSAHPLGSYEYIYEGRVITTIKITDPAAFWSLGNRFLAIIK